MSPPGRETLVRKTFVRKTRKVKDYAFNSIVGNSDRGGRTPVARESLHSNAGVYQADFEWCRGDCLGSLDAKCFWALSLPFPDPRWQVKSTQVMKPERTNTSSIQRNTADICLKEIL
jgi:hypothetical protein